jgi:polygalacturonase
MKVTVLTRCCAIVLATAIGFLCPAGAKGNMPQVGAPRFPKTTLNLADFGGAGNGATLNTGAFARAIGALSEQGGGTLVVAPGIWLTGPIKLRSHINLHLERGALIKLC